MMEMKNANVLLLDSRCTVGATKNSDSEVQRIAIDGKAIRAAAEKGGHIPYIISAYLGILCVCPAAYLFPYCNQTFSMLK